MLKLAGSGTRTGTGAGTETETETCDTRACARAHARVGSISGRSAQQSALLQLHFFCEHVFVLFVVFFASAGAYNHYSTVAMTERDTIVISDSENEA